jgi:hypothetical protein
LRSHTHTHTAKGEAGRGDAGEWPKYDKERRGRGGIEPHLERQTTASPKSQVQVETRERERNDRETGERGERRERGDTTQGSCAAKTAKCGRAPDRADLRPPTII